LDQRPAARHPADAIGALISILLVPMGTVANAASLDLGETATFSIPAEPLAAALLQFSAQAHIQVATSGSEVGRVQTRGAVGTMSLGAALSILLADTGFSYRISGERSIAIVLEHAGTAAAPTAGPPAGAGPVTAGPGPAVQTGFENEERRVNVSGDTEPKSRQGFWSRILGFFSGGGGKRTASPVASAVALCSAMATTCGAYAQSADTQGGAVEELQEVTVTGSRVITNGNDSPSPVTVMTAEDLQTTRPTTVFEALQELPAFASDRGGSLSGSTGQGGNNNSIAGLNLRGLGPKEDLILLDGHRVSPQNLDGQVDINMIPQMLLERVDVETGGSSAVYGSDAISGVVNFIVDRKFNGIKGKLQEGISNEGDAPSTDVGAAAGTELFGGRGHIEGSVQYHYNGGLLRSARDYVQPPGQSTWSAVGNGTAATPYFITNDAFSSNLSFGGKIMGNTKNPYNNYNFTTNGVLTPFNTGSSAGLPAGGTTQLGGDGGYGQANTLQAQVGFTQMFGRFDFDVTDDVRYFLSTFYDIEHQYSQIGNLGTNASASSALSSGFVMSVNNAYLPAAYASAMKAAGITTFNVGKLWDVSDVPPTNTDYHNHSIYVNTGFEGKFGQGWHWEISGTDSKIIQSNTANNTWSTGRLFAALDAVVNPANGQIVCQVSLTASANLYPGCVPMNIFGPTATTAQALAYVQQPSRYIGTTNMRDVEASISGAPFHSWAGPVNMALSGEWRYLDYQLISQGPPANVAPLDCTGLGPNCFAPSSTNIGISQTFANGTAGTPGAPVTQTVKEIAVEADVPVLADVPFAKDVSVILAGRNAGYSSYGSPVASIPYQTVTFSANTWKLGLDWHFNDAVTLRATRSRDFRAPNLSDLFLPGRVQGFSTLDALTGVTQPSQQQIGGNPNLKPEVGYTSTLGLVLKPSDRFSLALDLYDIAVENYIVTLNGSTTAYQQACYASGGSSPFCALQVRPGSFTNTAPSNTATLWYTALPLNLAELHTQGMDVETNFRFMLAGRPLQLRLLGTYQPHVWSLLPLAPTQDGSGVTVPRERLTGSVRYNLTDAFSIDWTTRWRSRLANLDPRVQPNAVLDGSQYAAAVAFTDLNLTYHVPQPSWLNLDVYLNVINAFNQRPPTYVPIVSSTSAFSAGAGSGGVGFYPQDDALGRYYLLGVRFKL
jgi:outer membrane receptor protein involved in Fe transport